MSDRLTAAKRYTVAELRTLYALFPNVRDVVVEGRYDARFIRHFIEDTRASLDEGVNINVFAINDRVALEDTDVIAAGFESGERGSVLTLAVRASTWPQAVRECLSCIVDADRAYVRPDLPDADVLLVTDHGSLETYALTPRVLSKFVQVVLHLDRPSGEELLAGLLPVLTDAFCARAVLHWSGLGLRIKDTQIKKQQMSANGECAEALLLANLPDGAAGLRELQKLQPSLARLRAASIDQEDPRRSVRGHDIALVLINMLGLKNKWADEAIVESALLGCIERRDIEDEPLFQRLMVRLRYTAAA